MTTEDDFQAKLDADPTDWQTRLVFADWLDERSDPRAEGYRALGLRRLWPRPEKGGKLQGGIHDQVFGFTTDLNPALDGQYCTNYAPSALPADWYNLFRSAEVLPEWDAVYWAHCYTRRAAEDAAALAYAQLTAPAPSGQSPTASP